MKLLWLGQNGLLFDFDGLKIMIDPYLTDSLYKEDKYFSRKIKLNKKLYKAKPDVIILSNGHLDHADNDSIEKLLKYTGKKKKTLILSCESVYNDITTIPSMSYANHIMFEKNSEWTVNNINIRAVPAKTDDKSAFGVIITDFSNDKKYYIACDTLYNSYVLDNIPNDVYASFLPINGEFGSMNVTDAKRVAQKVKSRFYVPVHFGMFDKVDPTLFDLPNAVIPKPYKIINFDDLESSVPNPYETEAVKKEEENSNKLLPPPDNLSNDEDKDNYDLDNEIDNVKKDEENNADNNNCGNTDEENDDESNILPLNDENDFFDGVVNEESDADEVDADEVDTNEVDTNEVDTDEVDTDEVNADEVDTDEVNADEVDTDEVDTDEVDADEADTDEVDTDEVDADEADTDEVDTDETENIESLDDEISEDDTNKDTVDENDASEKDETKIKFMNDSDRIDAYIKEIEKFERGETTDFSSIDDN